MKKWLFLILLISLSGCATTQPLPAPCDNAGTHCWPRTKINQWNN